MNITETQLHDAAKAICNSRELCGNEREAFNQWAEDNNIAPTTELYKAANFRAGQIWRNYQVAAGVPKKYIY